MKRILSVTLLAFLCGVVYVPAGDPAKKDDKNPRADQLKELEQDFKKIFPSVVKEWREAKDDAGRNKALARMDPFLDRAYKIVADSPKDDVSFDALLFSMRMKPETPSKTVDLLAEHHINNPKLANLLQQMANNPSLTTVKLMRTAFAKSMDKTVKGIASYGLGKWVFQQSEDAAASDLKKAATLNAEAQTLLETVIKEFGDVTVQKTPLAKLAEEALKEVRGPLAAGKKAPEVVSRDLDEKEVKLSSYKGKVVVLDIWATWCGPCRAMIPHERAMVEKLKNKPFVLISVSGDAKKEAVSDFLKKEPMPWVHWWEGQRETGMLKDWNVRFFPTIYVLDVNGVIRYKNVRNEKLEEAVVKLIKEAEGK